MSHGFYRDTAGKLPHPPIPLSLFLIVEEAIRESWRRLRSRPNPRIDIRTADEDDVTHDLYEVIFDEVFNKGLVEGFDCEHFFVGSREGKFRSFDGSHLDKMPDLTIGMANRDSLLPTQDWIFIECKPIDAQHTVGVHYCGKGISRFLSGEYAWAMTSALMLGYCDKAYTIQSKFFDAQKRRGAEFSFSGSPKPCSKSTSTDISEQVHSSSHDRLFIYLENNTQAPPITLRHLWLGRC